MHSPHPPLAPRYHYGLHPLVAGEPAGHSQLRAPGHCDCSGGHPPLPHHQSMEPDFSRMTSRRPNTAPGNMQQPPRLQPLRNGATVVSLTKTSSSNQKCHVSGYDQQFATGERTGLRLLNSVEYVTGVSPYQLPAINNYVMPVPPPRLQNRGPNSEGNGMPKGRRFHLTAAPSDAEQLPTKTAGGLPRSSPRSNALVTMIFLGKSVRLSHDDADYRDEIKVYQQHCGGENLCVYKGRLLEGETFQFISKRHHGFPFSLTFFLNGIQVDRLSCCCEYKHQKCSRLGGKHGFFAFLHVEGASPCYRCIIAMGLDKKPSPPKRKVKEDHEEKHVGFWGGGACSEPSKSSVEQKSRRNSVLVILPSHEASVETAKDEMKTKQEYGKQEMKKPADRKSEDSQEDTIKNGGRRLSDSYLRRPRSQPEYDEDFEADEEVNEEGQTDDQMHGMSKSSSDDKKHNLDYENESKTSSQKVLQASDSEEDGSGGYSDSDSEDDEQGGRPVHPLSSVSTQYSSEDDSCAETVKGNVEGKEEYNGERASDNTAHAQCGNENGENKLLRVEENQETSLLEKEGIDKAEKAKPEDLTARGDTFHENTTAVQHQSPEVNRELDQAWSVQSDTVEDGEKNTSTRRGDGEEGLLVPLESSVTEVEDSNDEAPHSDKGGVVDGCKPAQEEMAKAIGNGHHVNSEPEPGDSHVDEEEHITHAEHDASEAPDATSSAKRARTLDVQKAAEQVIREGQMEGERQALEEEESVAEGGEARTKEAEEEVARVGDLLPKEDTVAVLLVEGLLAMRESAPEESDRAEGDPNGKKTGKAMESGAEVAPKEQEGVMDVTGSLAARGQQKSKTVKEGGSQGKDVVVGETVSEAIQEGGSQGNDVVGEMLSEDMQEGGSEGKDIVVGEKVPEVVQEGGSAGKDLVEMGEKVSGAIQEGGSAGKDLVEIGEKVSEVVQEGGSAGRDIVEMNEKVTEVVQEGSSAEKDVVEMGEMVSVAVQVGGSAGKDVVEMGEMVSVAVQVGGSGGKDVVEMSEMVSVAVQVGDSAWKDVVEMSEKVSEVVQEEGSAGKDVVEMGEKVSELVQEGGSADKDVVGETVSETVQEGCSAGKDFVEMGEKVSEAVQEGGSGGTDIVEMKEKVAEAIQEGGSAGRDVVEMGEKVTEVVQEGGSTEKDVVEMSEMISEILQAGLSTGKDVLEMSEKVSEVVQEAGSRGKDVVEMSEKVSEAIKEEGSAGKDVVEMGEMISEILQAGASTGKDVLEMSEKVSEVVQEEGSAGKDVVEMGEKVSEVVQEGGSTEKDVVEMSEKVSEVVQEEGSRGKDVVEMGEKVSEVVQEGGSAGKDVLEMGERVSEAMQEGCSGGKDVVVEKVSEVVQQGGSAGNGGVVGAIPEAEEAVVEAVLAGSGFAGAAGSEGEEALKETISEGEEAVGKPVALLETLGDTDMCTGEAVPGGEDFVKPNEFSQLKASGEEWMEMGKAATPGAAEALEVEWSFLLRAQEAAEESVEPGKGPIPQEAPALESLVGAGGDPLSEGSPRLEETPAVVEEEGSAEALLCGNPFPGSKAKTEEAVEGKEDGGVGGTRVEVARAE
uniref:DUF4590 domain-containing protein n=1 Tax=Strigops habroptila TaxID=2489341 RepID=A0A672TYL7_STRHB